MQCQCTCTSTDNPKEKYVATMNNNTFTFNSVKMEEAVVLNRTEMVKHRKDKTIKAELSDNTINQTIKAELSDNTINQTIKAELSDNTINQTTNNSTQPNVKHQQYKLNSVWDVIGNQKNKKNNLQKMDKSVNHKEGSYNVSQSLNTVEKKNKTTTNNNKNSSINVWGQLKFGVKNNVLQHIKSVGKGHINPNNSPPHVYQDSKK
ncbi:unnamed protein product [Mytilus edulis]|uniref:Uncharacterized protein n=1 Tax=Mytilus edulis TaxID=6550 RepID=A0A8S3Q5G7_MYTED|nr:unnamed protein product [Mytilus edulis]